MMKMLPGMTVINPCDYNQTKLATIALGEHVGPAYLRFGRPKWPIFTPENTKFQIGKGIKFLDGNDISIFATGHMLWQALEAEKILFSLGVSCEVINIHTIKPLDEEIILESIKKTKCAISCEEHNIIGGLGESISRLISEKYPIPFKVIGVNDSFGESGKPLDLLEKYNLNPESIKEAALEVINKK